MVSNRPLNCVYNMISEKWTPLHILETGQTFLVQIGYFQALLPVYNDSAKINVAKKICIIFYTYTFLRVSVSYSDCNIPPFCLLKN